MKLPFAGRLLAVAMLAAASAALPLSSAFADDTATKPKVALVMKSLANEFFVTMEDGAKAVPERPLRRLRPDLQRDQERNRYQRAD